MPSLQVEMSRLLERVRALDLELKQAREVEGALRASASEQNRAAQEQLLASEARFHHLVDAVTTTRSSCSTQRGTSRPGTQAQRRPRATTRKRSSAGTSRS